MNSTPSSQGDKGAQSPKSPMPSSDRKSNENIDSLVEHLRSIEGVESDFAIKIAENWQKMLGLMAVILVGVWLVGSYQSQQVKKGEDASNLFVEAQTAFRALPPAGAADDLEKARSDALAKIDANLKLVSKSYPESVYSDMAPIYDALAKASSGETEAAYQLLAPYAAEARENGRYSPQAGLSKKRFVDELGAFVYAKLLLEDSARREEAVKLMTELAKNSAVMAPEAAVSLVRVAKTDDEIGEALTTARAVMESRPEIAGVLARELQTLGLEAPVNPQARVISPAEAG